MYGSGSGSVSVRFLYPTATDNFTSTTEPVAGTSVSFTTTATTYTVTRTLDANANKGLWVVIERGATGSGVTWSVENFQLEKGSTATSFDYRPYGTELQLCQRYYARMVASDLFTAFGSSVVSSATSVAAAAIKLPTTMRAQPTTNYSAIRVFDGSANPSITTIGNNRSSIDMWSGDLGAAGGGLTTGRCAMVQAANNASAWVDASAEL